MSNNIEEDIREKHLDFLNNAAITSNSALNATFRKQEKYVIQVLDELLEDK